MIVASPTWRMLLMHLVCCALALALARAGSSMLARIAMIAITTRSSIRVKPRLARLAGRTPEQSGSPFMLKPFFHFIEDNFGLAGGRRPMSIRETLPSGADNGIPFWHQRHGIFQTANHSHAQSLD